MGIVSHVHVEGTCNLDGIRGGPSRTVGGAILIRMLTEHC